MFFPAVEKISGNISTTTFVLSIIRRVCDFKLNIKNNNFLRNTFFKCDLAADLKKLF